MDVDGVVWDPEGPSQQISWDEEGDVPGFGVRVYRSGTKSFVVWVRNRDTGRKRLLTVGRVGELTLSEARDEAARKVEEYRRGGPGRPVVGRPAEARHVPEPASELTPTQVLELFAAIDQERNPFRRAAMRFYALTHLPRSELLRLEWADVDLERGALRLGRGGEEEGSLRLPPDAVSVLAALPRREDNPYVFCGGRRGSHVSGLGASWRVARERAGLADVSLDDLRRALASGAAPRPAAADTAAAPAEATAGAAELVASTGRGTSRERTTSAEGGASVDVNAGGSPTAASAPAQADRNGPTAVPRGGGGRRSPPRLPARTLGIEVAPGRLRAYRPARRRRPAEAMEVEWGSPVPRASVDALVERFGADNMLSVALDMAFVHVKRLELPPLPMEERRRMISLDSRRYFPILDEDLVAGVRDDDLVIAASAPSLDTWVDALGAVGTVERVEATPSALARHLAAEGFGDGVLILAERSERDVTLARVESASLTALRKVPAGAAEVFRIVSEMAEAPSQVVLDPFRDDIAGALGASVGGPSVASMPAPAGSPPSFAAARGAALGVAAGPELTLSTPVLERRLRVAGRRRAVFHVTALAATLALLGGALDHRRSETLAGLEEEIASTQDEAAQVLELNREAEAIAAELSLLAGEMRARANPMDVLLEVTRLLPTSAYLTQLTYTGDQWELGGLAEDAAALIPLLEASPRLTDVRFRAPTTRARAQGRDVESFSVAFRHVPAT